MSVVLRLALGVLLLPYCNISAQIPGCSNNTYAPQNQPYGWNPQAVKNLTLSSAHDPQQPIMIMILMPNNTAALAPLSHKLLENLWGSMPSSTFSPSATSSLQPTVPSTTTRRPRARIRGRRTSTPTVTITTPSPHSSTSSVALTSTTEQPQSSTTAATTTPATTAATTPVTHTSEPSTSQYPQSSSTHDPQTSTPQNPFTAKSQTPLSTTTVTIATSNPTSTTSNSEISTTNPQTSTASTNCMPNQQTSTASTYQQLSTTNTDISSQPATIPPSSTTTSDQQYSTTSNADTTLTDYQSSSSSSSNILTTTTINPTSSTTTSEIGTTTFLQSSTSSYAQSSTRYLPRTSSSSFPEYSSTDDYTTEEWYDDSDYSDTSEDSSDLIDYSFAEVESSKSLSSQSTTSLHSTTTVVSSTTTGPSAISATTRDPQSSSVMVTTSNPTLGTTNTNPPASVPYSTTQSDTTTTRYQVPYTFPPPPTSTTQDISFWPCLGSAPMGSSYQTVSEMLSNNGYHSEAHLVHTADRYLLCLHRIPHGRNSTKSSSRPVVVLQHGIPGSSVDWLVAGPHRALAYLLADAGYDVWMSNLRGNDYSQGHEYLDPHSDRYWSFSLDEMAMYDIPAVLDHILHYTDQSSVLVVTQSTGSAVLLATLSSRPCYNHNIKAAYHLAPAVYLANNTDFSNLHSSPRTGRFSPSPQLLDKFGSHKCLSHRDAVPEEICKNFRFLVGGYSHCNMTKEVLAALINYSFAGTSEKSYLHYSQILASGVFRQFDYGPLSNLMMYARVTPPEYDLGLVTTPNSIFYSELDPVVSHREINWLAHELPNIVEVRHVPYYTHWDFLWGPRVRIDVYNHILQQLKQLNQTSWLHSIPPICPLHSSR